MKTISTIKLGTECRDKATQLAGTVTHWFYDMGGRIDYLFQPRGLNPETGQPIDKISLEAERLEIGGDCYEDIQVPNEILGTIVTDRASGFTGMAVNFVRHSSGCFHVTIQPAGLLPKTGSPIRKRDFDLRECRGDKIPQLPPVELKQSRQEVPSPSECHRDDPADRL